MNYYRMCMLHHCMLFYTRLGVLTFKTLHGTRGCYETSGRKGEYAGETDSSQYAKRAFLPSLQRQPHRLTGGRGVAELDWFQRRLHGGACPEPPPAR